MNTAATRWEVQIQGGASELEYMSRHFNTPTIHVTKDADSGNHVLYCDTFDACTSSQSVLLVANEQLIVMSGVLRFTRDTHQPLKSGAVYRRHADGRRDIFVHISEGMQLRAECGVLTATVTDVDGNIVAPPPPAPERAVVLAALARADVSVAKAMRLFSQESKDWVSLYRIFEVIEADAGGEAALKKCGWASAKQMKRFKHSANSVAVAGDAARHGKEDGLPPSDPMSIEEAAAYVHYVLHAWLAFKGA